MVWRQSLQLGDFKMAASYCEDNVLLKAIFKHCPQCQAPSPQIHAARKLVCPNCELEFFFNTAAAAGAFVFSGQSLILCVRSKDPGRGLLDVPGGFVEFGETIEEGLRREIREELSIEVDELHYFASAPNRYLYRGTPYQTADLFFVARTQANVIVPEVEEIEAIHLQDPGSIDPNAFAFPSTRTAFLKLKDWMRLNTI